MRNMTSFYGSSCASNGKGTLHIPENSIRAQPLTRPFTAGEFNSLGLHTDIQPLIRPFTAEDFNSPPNVLRAH
eukprot:1188925-Prorocentrum_minimum.AAC.2